MRTLATLIALGSLGLALAASTGQAAPSTDPGQSARGADRDIEVRPDRIPQGDRFRVRGHGFAANRRVRLFVGAPDEEPTRIGRATTNDEGRFLKRFRLDPETPVGAYVMLACRRHCAIREQDRFRVIPG